MAKTADQIEKELWERFDAGTKQKNPNKADFDKPLNRNKTDTEKDKKSRRFDYRANLEKRLAAGEWTDTAEAYVWICCKKAGTAARIIADAQGQNNCTIDIFNLACDITAALYRIDTGGQSGIVC